MQAYLREHHVMTLATSGDEGPWAAAVFYVHEGNALYFLSAPTSRHCRNLAKNPRVSATIQEDTSDWKAIKGIQMEGIASRLSGDQEERIRRLYGAKFPLVAESADAPAAISEALAKVSWYKVAAERTYFIDNSIAFGHRDEVDTG
ncbi:MAG: pyridoxamine 5'-phosphate oxidase family protein [Betaproteobacteria bacterium]|nr:pyridoxamine 5'-phosphate oxidase family protein [Betaproteobacteria bacterium]